MRKICFAYKSILDLKSHNLLSNPFYMNKNINKNKDYQINREIERSDIDQSEGLNWKLIQLFIE
jgi:hypothetical protein